MCGACHRPPCLLHVAGLCIEMLVPVHLVWLRRCLAECREWEECLTVLGGLVSFALGFRLACAWTAQAWTAPNLREPHLHALVKFPINALPQPAASHAAQKSAQLALHSPS